MTKIMTEKSNYLDCIVLPYLVWSPDNYKGAIIERIQAWGI